MLSRHWLVVDGMGAGRTETTVIAQLPDSVAAAAVEEEEIVVVARVVKPTHVLILGTIILRTMMMLVLAFPSLTLRLSQTMLRVEMTCLQLGVMVEVLVEVFTLQGPLLSGLITVMVDITVVI